MLDAFVFFSENDVALLAKIAQLPLARDADELRLATALVQVFSNAASEHYYWRHYLSDEKLRSKFRQIATTAQKLSDLLETKADPSNRCVVDIARYSGISLLSNAQMYLDQPEEQKIKSSWILEFLDRLKLIQDLATSASYHLTTSSRRGRPIEVGLLLLFTGLAAVFFASFGTPPVLGSDRVDPSHGSNRWVSAVLTVALCRLTAEPKVVKEDTPGVIMHDQYAEGLASLVFGAAELTMVSKANRLAEGWHRWSALPPDDKWSPFGRRIGPEAGGDSDCAVPEWLVDNRFMEPQP